MAIDAGAKPSPHADLQRGDEARSDTESRLRCRSRDKRGVPRYSAEQLGPSETRRDEPLWPLGKRFRERLASPTRGAKTQESAMSLLRGKTALVTGGGTGIGFGVARRLVEHGAGVTIVGRREDVLAEAAARLRQTTPQARVKAQVCDVTQEDQVAAAVKAAAGDGGRLDVLVANAGSGFPGAILELGAEAWRYCCDLNILGTALCIKHGAKAMQERGGSIITISSTGGAKVEKWMAPYSTTKAGLEMLTRCAALELAPFQIRVNCIQPGYVTTEATEAYFPPDFKQRVVEHTPLGRPGTPAEIGDGVLYLASDLSRWVTGQVFGIDGGLNIPIGEDFEDMCRALQGDAAVDAWMAKPTSGAG